MAITMPKKMSLDVAADVSSADSLSFASFVCINDQQSMSQSGQVVSFPLNHSQVSPRVSFKDLSPPTHRRSRRSNNESGRNKADREPNSEVRNQANKKHGDRGQSFGQKMFRSFANPCKSCHALEPSPSKKVHKLQQGNIKLH
ncbi:hypothetical protein F0562_014015 [Nyssa sinensis]|uniref:Uncharacterized protein n=1 Tax=Nyssa sinensis TaxID=561372 RepID=A0A5J4ZP57_9ASTE|nr:hypothetical protein F0562_014015 [Nyssa sinensis]